MLFKIKKLTKLKFLIGIKNFNLNASFCSKIPNDKYMKIGNISKQVIKSKNPELIPIKYLPKEHSQELLNHIQWIMKKELLNQDIFIIGLPGPLKKRLIYQYAELMEREVEYIVLSRDTTESDLKQRREIRNGNVHYENQSAVKAAIEGRILILDGIEKAERNVLPILNNLLENREIQLEDGHFLVAAERYDKLLLENSKEVLDAWKFIRVSENFRVIALGLPVPLFLGNPLDPPFRSRFQARELSHNFDEYLLTLSSVAPNIEREVLVNFLKICNTFLTNESTSLGIPKFPIENINIAAHIMNKIPKIPLNEIIEWMFPISFLSNTAKKSIKNVFKKFNVRQSQYESYVDFITDKHKKENSRIISIRTKNDKFQLEVPCQNYKSSCTESYVANKYHDNILSKMMQTHVAHDFCIIGGKGSGKTMLVKKFSSLLSYPVETIMLYKDMTARDLLQQRITEENGNTSWRYSRLINAALSGKLAILDGLHRVHQSTLATLKSLIYDRELQLYDGTRLLRHDRYDSIKEKYSFDDFTMELKKIKRIHPSFRIIALAEPPKLSNFKDKWLTPELLSMFFFHTVKPLTYEMEKNVIQQLVGPLSEKMESVLHFAHLLRNSEDETLHNVSVSLSTRQLIRIAKKLSLYPHESSYQLITQACLLKFLPELTKQALQTVLTDAGIEENNKTSKIKDYVIKDGKLFIGNTSADLYKPGQSKVKVPNVLFYNNSEHLTIMKAMLQDFNLGENLLLIGNQGVGKNKISDHFLQLLNRPREYIQLHRDTTVQSLTQQPSIIKGKITYEDSPLVKAVQSGYVLVVDEADKAPTHVTCVLKGLVESGEMALSDGRIIVHHTDPRAVIEENKKDIVVMHPDFRMIVLANRPGFPFLGNDFFAILGDVFSCHAVENPSLESEIEMLRKYGPSVPEDTLLKVVHLFGELRTLSDSGVISYPYSTREVVNIVKHLQKFNQEGLPQVLKNVFDFDAYSNELKEILSDVFYKHGIPFGASTAVVNLVQQNKLPEPYLLCNWRVNDEIESISASSQNFKMTDRIMLPVSKQKLDPTEVRCNTFTEQEKYWQLPLNENDIPLDVVAVNKSEGLVHIATANPVSLTTLDMSTNNLYVLDLSKFFPSLQHRFHPEIKLAPLGSPFNDCILFFENITNQAFIVNPYNGQVIEINLSSVFNSSIAKFSKMFHSRTNVEKFKLFPDFSHKNLLMFYSQDSCKIIALNLNLQKSFHLESPENINFILSLNENQMFVICKNNKYILDISDIEKWKFSKIEEHKDLSELNLIKVAKQCTVNNQMLSTVVNTEEGTPATILGTPNDYAAIALNFPSNKDIKVYSFPRKHAINADTAFCILPKNMQIVRVLEKNKIDNSDGDSICLEVVDLTTLTYCHIPAPVIQNKSTYAQWLASISNVSILICPLNDERLITLDTSGTVRIWETVRSSLETSLKKWYTLIGGSNSREFLKIEHTTSSEVKGPKHGKVDPTGAPHVGGNTWAGGTGGRDTAGLGGKGGPYRLDAGHQVFQISDMEKQNVPPDIKAAAREMAVKAYKEKLKEIEMSEYDAQLYEKFSNNVQKQVHVLRMMLDNLQAKSKERQWLKHQTHGELDDTKLIEGITGEKLIYKRRGEQTPEMGTPQEKPKKLRLVVDVSGSMYRFNGHDSRLERELASVIMVMEAFAGYQDKLLYDIIGHSGEDFCIEFVKFENPPKHNKERLDVLKKMYAHSQFCMSGDNTLNATQYAIETISKEEADEYFVIVMSDANFDRYGISPHSFGKLLVKDPKVNAFAIFIGSLGDQAESLAKVLPAGRCFICFDTAEVPQILKQIFTSALLHEQ